jgi:hypothetical protein
MHANSIRPTGAVLLTVADGVSLLLGAAYLTGIAYAQAHGPDGDGLGIMAAPKDGLTDCEGDSVYASPHTGTTAWYILAASRVTPLSATTPISAP